jgi:hypothetical protein
VGVCLRAFDVERFVDLLSRVVHVRVVSRASEARRRTFALDGAKGLVVWSNQSESPLSLCVEYSDIIAVLLRVLLFSVPVCPPSVGPFPLVLCI